MRLPSHECVSLQVVHPKKAQPVLGSQLESLAHTDLHTSCQ